MSALSFLARRFVAGERAPDAVRAGERLQARGIRATFDLLGEDVEDREAARRCAQANVELLRLILEKAGPDLNYGTFMTAAYNLGPVMLPGYPDEWNFDRDHPDGQAPISMYQGDAKSGAMAQLAA